MADSPLITDNCSVDPGDTTWLLVSTALVLNMSPALAMFEAGLLRSHNTLSIFTQIFSGMIVCSMLWLIGGYSLVFGESAGGFIGNPIQHAFFVDVSYHSCGPHAASVPAAAFAIFQMMFAVITPLLITGAFAERMNFRAFMAFTVAWSVLVYYPVAHWIWGNGFMSRWGSNGVLDFAGGITIHTTAGVASLISAIVIGQREDFDMYHGEFPPSNLPLAASGAGLLYLGWFGFNGGSALSAGSVATSAVVSTQIGAVSSGFVWLCMSWYRGKPSTSALLNGMLAGLAGITPASGFINSPASMLLGLLLGLSSYVGAYCLKHKWHIDDALEVSMVHGLTGALGALFIGLFGQLSLNPNGADGAIYGNPIQLLIQLLAIVIVAAWSVAFTFAILTVIGWIFGGIRLSPLAERVGGDWAEHGEIAYHKLHVLDENDRRNAAHRQFEETERERNHELIDEDRKNEEHDNVDESDRSKRSSPPSNGARSINGFNGGHRSPLLDRSGMSLEGEVDPLPHSDMYRRQDVH